MWGHLFYMAADLLTIGIVLRWVYLEWHWQGWSKKK